MKFEERVILVLVALLIVSLISNISWFLAAEQWKNTTYYCVDALRSCAYAHLNTHLEYGCTGTHDWMDDSFIIRLKNSPKPEAYSCNISTNGSPDWSTCFNDTQHREINITWNLTDNWLEDTNINITDNPPCSLDNNCTEIVCECAKNTTTPCMALCFVCPREIV